MAFRPGSDLPLDGTESHLHRNSSATAPVSFCTIGRFSGLVLTCWPRPWFGMPVSKQPCGSSERESHHGLHTAAAACSGTFTSVATGVCPMTQMSPAQATHGSFHMRRKDITCGHECSGNQPGTEQRQLGAGRRAAVGSHGLHLPFAEQRLARRPQGALSRQKGRDACQGCRAPCPS